MASGSLRDTIGSTSTQAYKGCTLAPVQGLITSVTTTGGMVEVLITYQFQGEYYCDYHKRDLFWTESAKKYASQFPAETSCVIRVNRADPQETALFDEDQSPATVCATAAH
jgi:hypothetical protein